MLLDLTLVPTTAATHPIPAARMTTADPEVAAVVLAQRAQPRAATTLTGDCADQLVIFGPLPSTIPPALKRSPERLGERRLSLCQDLALVRRTSAQDSIDNNVYGEATSLIDIARNEFGNVAGDEGKLVSR